MNTIQSEWESYLKDVLPEGVDPIQVQETRRGFYAGAWAMNRLVLNMPDNISEAAAMAMIESLIEECKAFLDQVIKELT